MTSRSAPRPMCRVALSAVCFQQDDSNLPSIDDELSEMRASADRGTSLVREPSARKVGLSFGTLHF